MQIVRALRLIEKAVRPREETIKEELLADGYVEDEHGVFTKPIDPVKPLHSCVNGCKASDCPNL